MTVEVHIKVHLGVATSYECMFVDSSVQVQRAVGAYADDMRRLERALGGLGLKSACNQCSNVLMEGSVA